MNILMQIVTLSTHFFTTTLVYHRVHYLLLIYNVGLLVPAEGKHGL
jgi:hypothetical protein